MAKYEAHLKTIIGDVVINFDSTDDLKKAVDSLDLNAVSDIITKKFGSALAKKPRQPKPGLEAVYRFTPDGKVELLKTPSSVPMTIGLLLYASDPEPMSSEELLSRGITAGNYVSNTAYKKYFDKADGSHILTQPGREWVETEIIPKLMPKSSRKKSE